MFFFLTTANSQDWTWKINLTLDKSDSTAGNHSNYFISTSIPSNQNQRQNKNFPWPPDASWANDKKDIGSSSVFQSSDWHSVNRFGRGQIDGEVGLNQWTFGSTRLVSWTSGGKLSIPMHPCSIPSNQPPKESKASVYLLIYLASCFPCLRQIYFTF